MKEMNRVRWLQGMLFSIVSIGLTAAAGAANKAVDLKTAGLPTGGRQMAFLLEEPPRYSLELRSADLVLTLYDTQKSNLVAQKATALTQWLQTEPGAGPADLKFLFKLTGAPTGIKASWEPKQKVFYLEIKDGPPGAVKESKDRVSLQRVRFAIQEEYTRIVLDCDRSPLWEIRYLHDKQIHWFLEAVPASQVGKKFGPFRRVKEVMLQELKQKTDLDIQLENELPQINLVWEATGKRLVMDLNDRPFAVRTKELDFAFTSAAQQEPVAAQAAVKTSNAPEVFPAPDPKNPVKTAATAGGTTTVAGPREDKQTAGVDKPLLPEPAEKATEVKPQIPVKDPEPAEAPKDLVMKPFVPYADFKIEPLLETGRPGVFSRNDLIKNLSGNEAFLFGRIQEAWESKDYERGTAMINSFIEIFPKSTLNESLAFLQGDFLLALMKSGRKEILPQVVRTYQNASTRFENSSEVPYALLKVAQAYAFNADYYNALGNLNTIITNFSKGEHISSTYITRGKVYLQLKQPDKAIADFKHILEHFPKSAFANEARYGIAEYFHSEAVYDEAERRLKEIEERDPYFYLQYPEYLFLHGKNLVHLGEYDAARKYFFKGLNLGQQPETGDLLLAYIGDTYFQEEKSLEAEKFYQLILEYYPKSEGATIAKIRLASYDSGVSGFQEVVDEKVPKPIQNLAMLKMARKQYDEKQYGAALQTLEKLIAQFATTTGIKKETVELYHSGMEGEVARLFQAQQHEDLIRFYEAGHAELMTDLGPNFYMTVAQSFLETGRYHNAGLTLLKIKASDLTPELKGKYVAKLAESYFKEGELQKSEDLLKKSLAERFAPVDKQRMTLVLARLFQKKGDLKQADQLVQSIVKGERLLLDHEIAEVYLFIGQIFITERKYEKSREALSRCITLTEKDKNYKKLLYSALVKMADSYHYEGKHTEALKYYEKSYDQGFDRQSQGFMEVRFRQAGSLIETGDLKEAQVILGEIAEEGDFAMQQRAQMKLGTLELSKQLKQLHFKEGSGGGTI